MKNKAVFISDLHLHPDMPEITARFKRFVDWAKNQTESLYILGDFFHVWVGDDLMDEFAFEVIALLNELHAAHVKVYFMPGNRDFLIGKRFLNLANIQSLKDSTIVYLDDSRVYLTHGDRFCLNDKPHQLLRLISRPWLFRSIFLTFPKQFRAWLVHSVRRHSQVQKRDYHSKRFQVVLDPLFKDMARHQVYNVIYGHVHQPEHRQVEWNGLPYNVFVLSDWDFNPSIICYNSASGYHMKTIEALDAK
jgi:UDP-2,3-diacylglucosamine hydrolase